MRQQFFDFVNRVVFFSQIKEKKRLHITNGKDYERIDTDSIKHTKAKEIGTDPIAIGWLCLQAINELGTADFLQQAGWLTQQIQLALTHIISRATYPALELRTCDWIKKILRYANLQVTHLKK